MIILLYIRRRDLFVVWRKALEEKLKEAVSAVMPVSLIVLLTSFLPMIGIDGKRDPCVC